MASRTDLDEIQSLNEEVFRLSEQIKAQASAGAEDVRRRASYTARAASDVVQQAKDSAGAEGAAVARIVRDHPVATGSGLAIAASLGVLLGYTLCALSQDDPPRRRYW